MCVTNGFAFGEYEIRPDERRLLAAGSAVTVGARAFDLLLCLIEQRGQVVSKEELLRRVWPRQVVEENNLSVHMSALRKLLGPEAVATVVGRGYRFVLPVRELTPADAPILPGPDESRTLELPDKPSIVVLPLDNLSGDVRDDPFVDGITEDVTTELSRFHTLFVIARNSAFTYKGRAVDVRAVARELGVQFVLEGSVRCGAGRVRVTAQLIDALGGSHVWAERFDREHADVFALQSELAQAIVGAIAREIYRVELQRAQCSPARHPTAHALAMRAHNAWRRAARETDPRANEEARRLALQALEIDPRCAPALRVLVLTGWLPTYTEPPEVHAAAVAEGLEAAERALEIDNGDHQAILYRGLLLSHAGRPEEGLDDMRRAHEINPNDPVVLGMLGAYLAGAGDPPAGLACVADAMRLSPRDPQRWFYCYTRAMACFFAADYPAAAGWARRAAAEAPRLFNAHTALALACAGLGDAASARVHLEEMRRLASHATAQRLAGRWPFAHAPFVERATRLLNVAAGLAAR